MDNSIYIEYLKSGLSINSHIGCNLNCQYCVLKNIDNFPDIPNLVREPKELVEDLIKNSLFIKNVTPLYINNRTDPFLPQVKESTYKILDLLEKNEVYSPIIIVTKLAPDDRMTDFCNKLNIIFIYTYAALPEGLDYNSHDYINHENFKAVKKYVPYKNRFHYYRPIVPGYNDNMESFVKACNIVGKDCRAIIAGGIRQVKDSGFLLDMTYVNKYNTEHKFFSKKFFEDMKVICQKFNINLVRHTTCAIANFMNCGVCYEYFEQEEHCNKNCRNHSNCSQNRKEYKISELDEFIRQIYQDNFYIDNEGTVYFPKTVGQEVLAAIKCAFGCKVIAEDIMKSKSEQMITFHSDQVIEEKRKKFGIVCDCHNTLMNSNEAWIEAFVNKTNNSERERIAKKLYGKKPRRELAKEYGIDFEILEKEASKYLKRNELLIGILDTCSKIGIPIYIISNAPRYRVEGDLSTLNLKKFYKRIYAAEDGGKRNNKLFDKILKKEKLDFAIFIGNEEFDDYINHPQVVSLVLASFLKKRNDLIGDLCLDSNGRVIGKARY